jgi:hypothetical protein
MRTVYGWAVAAALIAAPAHAALTPRQLLDRGDYVAAADQGRARGDADGLAVAARADLVRAAFQATDKAAALALIDQAQRDAEAAVQRSSGAYLAKLQLASAVGYRASLTTSRSLGKEAKHSLEELTRSEPQRPEAWIALGVWHGETILKLGGLIARAALGASKSQMSDALNEAARRDGGVLAPGYRGLLLVRMGDVMAARPYLAAAIGQRPRDAHEGDIRQAALDVARLIDKGDLRAARHRADETAAFGKLRKS